VPHASSGEEIMKAHNSMVAWCGAALLLVSPGPCAADTWPQWRGPQRSGHTDEADLPSSWDGKTGENVLWKVGRQAALLVVPSFVGAAVWSRR
jgi:hypothetical protein